MNDLQKEIECFERNIRKSESEISSNERSIDKDEIIYALNII